MSSLFEDLVEVWRRHSDARVEPGVETHFLRRRNFLYTRSAAHRHCIRLHSLSGRRGVLRRLFTRSQSSSSPTGTNQPGLAASRSRSRRVSE